MQYCSLATKTLEIKYHAFVQYASFFSNDFQRSYTSLEDPFFLYRVSVNLLILTFNYLRNLAAHIFKSCIHTTFHDTSI